MERQNSLIKLAAALLLSAAFSGAQATIIDLSTGTGSCPMNMCGGTYLWDNADFSELRANGDTGDLVVTKDFFGLEGLTLDGSFTNGGATNVVHVTETITNGSNDVWLDYHLNFLFTNSCTPSAPCIDGGTVSGISVTNGMGTTGAFADNDPGADIELIGGEVAIGGTLTIEFDLTIVADNGAVNFSIFQFPSIDGGRVPEPTTLGLIGLGLAGLGAKRRKS